LHYLPVDIPGQKTSKQTFLKMAGSSKIEKVSFLISGKGSPYGTS